MIDTEAKAPSTGAGETSSAAAAVVVVGAGFGGLEAAKHLGKAGIAVTVVDRHNHHLFQPLLYQVATAALAAPDIAEPIRKILRGYPTVRVVFGDVVTIDTAARRVLTADGLELSYTILVLAPGSRPSYFGHDQWASCAPGLKTIEDARSIRSRLLLTFERAERTPDKAEQARLMTIAVVGGGPTGVELAGSIAELSRYTLSRDFRNIHPQSTRILLIEAGDRLLSGFSPDMSTFARRRLERLGVEILTQTPVADLAPDRIKIGDRWIPVGLAIWAAGVTASPLAAALGVPLDKGGRVAVGPNLQVTGLDDVFALGDIALARDKDGTPLPGLAQVAKQQGIYLGRALAARILGKAEPSPFVYRSRGNTAIIGRHAAVFELGRLKLKGWLAWAAWALIHVYLLVGFQHRVLVSIQWLWRYLTYERGARLIAGDQTTPGSSAVEGT